MSKDYPAISRSPVLDSYAGFMAMLRAVPYGNPAWACAQNCADKIEDLLVENERLRAALVIYADRERWTSSDGGWIDDIFRTKIDGWEYAAKALAGEAR